MQKCVCVGDISTKVVKGYFFMFTGYLLLLMSFRLIGLFYVCTVR